MRALLINPLLLLLAAACGWGVCAGFGHPPRVAEVAAAAMICLAAGELAVIPLLLTRGASVAAVTQAGLVGTMVHLLVAAIGAAVMLLEMHPAMSFSFWLMGFYLVSLVGLVIELIKAIRSAPAKA